MKRLVLLLVSVLFAAPAWAGGFVVTRAWIRHLPAGVPAGGYFVLRNDTGHADALVAASSPAYARVMMHRTLEQGGVSRMLPVERVDLPVKGEVAFRPGGYHLMLMHATRPIAVGTTVPVTLEFASGATLAVRFAVRAATAQ